MASENSVTLVGNLTKDPELRYTTGGRGVASFGLAVGLFCAWLLTRVEISNLLELAFRDRLMRDTEATGVELDVLRLTVNVTLFASLGFLGAVLALRSNRDDFAFIIPYMRFRQDSSSGQPVVLDGDAVMDGRRPGPPADWAKSGRTSKDSIGPSGGEIGGPAPQV